MNFILLIITYFLLLLIWSTISLVAYALTIVFKKTIFIKFISGTSQAVGQILLFILSFYFMFLILSFFTHNFILIIIGAVLIGSLIIGVISSLLNFIIMPFMFLPMYLNERYEKDIQEEEVIAGEVVDDKGKVIGKTEEGRGMVNRKLAIYFLIDYVLIEAYVFLHRSLPQYSGWGVGDYIIEPVFWIGSEIVVFGIFVLVFNLIKHRKFFPYGKKRFLFLIIKIDIAITSILLILSIL